MMMMMMIMLEVKADISLEHGIGLLSTECRTYRRLYYRDWRVR